MISALRRSFKTRLYKAILWITILATAGVFSAFEMVRVFLGPSSSRWVAKINNQAIDVSVFQRKVADEQERVRMLRAQYGQYADLIMQMMHASNDPEVAALHAVIRETLLNQAVKNLPLTVGAESIGEKLSDLRFIQEELSDVIPMFAIEAPGVVNTRALRTYLQRSGISAETFDALVTQAIKRNLLNQLVSAADYIPLFELKRQFIKEYGAKKFSVKKIPYDALLADVKKEKVSDDDLQSFFDRQNSQLKRYMVPERRSASLWTFTPAGFNITVDDQVIDEYYQAHKTKEFVQSPAQVQVRRILLRIDDPVQSSVIREKAEKLRTELIKSPELFEKKAQELSDDKATATNGGLIPAFSKGQREEAFERTAFTLKDDGAISPVISTTQGFEILQRVNKKPIAYKPLASAKEEIKQKLVQDKFNTEFNAQARALLHEPGLTTAKVEAFALSKKAKERDIKDVVQDNGAMGKTLFRLKEGETGYYQDGNQGVLITATAIKQPHVPALASIKDNVRNDFYADKATQELNKKLEQAVKAAQTEPLSGSGIETVDWLKKCDAKRISELEKKGIPATKLLQLENIGAATSTVHQGNGYVMRLDEVAPFDQELFEKEKNKLRAETSKQRSTLLMGGFVASLWRSATIEKNQSVLHPEA